MARKSTQKWAFKPGLRAGAFGWRGSAKAIDRLKAASAEIRAVRRSDPVTAAEGVVALSERIWPAFEHIDTSSGALGTAVHRTLETLLPVLIDAPADQKTRAAWLERLRTAIRDDGVDYLAPISERFGEIAAFPALMNDHADRDLDLIRAAWSDHARFSVSGSTRSSPPKPCCARGMPTTHSHGPRLCWRATGRPGATTTWRGSARRSCNNRDGPKRRTGASACPRPGATRGSPCGAIW
jgi:hypothetical protein